MNPFKASLPNMEAIIALLFPYIQAWAYVHRYNCPTIKHFNVNVDYSFHDSPPPADLLLEGQYSPYWDNGGEIDVVINRNWLITMAHEMAHAVQHYHMDEDYMSTYSRQTEEKSYWDNQFEVEARECGDAVAHLDPTCPILFIAK